MVYRLQDHVTRILNGAGTDCDGLYSFQGVSGFQVNVAAVDSCGLWHRRLGHPLQSLLFHLSGC